MTANEIIPTLRSLKPGQRLVYHTGLLARDRTGKSAASRETNSIAEEAWALYGQRKAFLFQRRVLPGVCNYIAIGREATREVA